MKATLRILVGLLPGLLISTVPEQARAASPHAAMGALTALTVGQTETDAQSTEEARAEVAELLERARHAMEAGNLETADSYISRAEAKNVRFGILYLGDTPAKARRDWERLEKKSSAPQKPSQRFTPGFMKSLSDKPQNPFDAPREGEASPAAAQSRITMNDAKSNAVNYLTKGRKELGRGDLLAAEHWCRLALEQNAEFASNEDSPQRLLADIQAAGGGTSLVGSAAQQPSRSPLPQLSPEDIEPQTPNFLLKQREFAEEVSRAATGDPGQLTPEMVDSPMGHRIVSAPPSSAPRVLPTATADGEVAPTGFNQPVAPQEPTQPLLDARRALAVGDVRRAVALVEQAEQSGEEFDLHADSPERVRTLLEDYDRTMKTHGADPATETARRAHSLLLLQQAEGLLEWNDLDEAERLAVAAARLRVQYGPFDTQPKDLLERIAERRRQPTGATEISSRKKNQPGADPAAGATTERTQRPDEATIEALKQRATELLTEARAALASGDLDKAEALVSETEALGIPDASYGPQDDSPWLVLLEIQKARVAGGSTLRVTSTGEPPAASQPTDQPAPPERAETQPAAPEQTASAAQATPEQPAAEDDSHRRLKLAVPPTSEPTAPQASNVAQLVLKGEEALRNRDLVAAAAYLRQASSYQNQLDPEMRQRLEQNLNRLNASSEAQPPSLIEDAVAGGQVHAKQVSADVARSEQRAHKMREIDPKAALELLVEARSRVENEKLDSASHDAIMRRLNRSIAEVEKYLEDNAALIELNERNQQVRDRVDREQMLKVEVQEKIALMVDDYNRLMNEQRYAEAELVAKQVQQIAPDDKMTQQLVKQLVLQSSLARRLANSMELRDAKEQGYLSSLESVEQSSVPFDDRRPYLFPDAHEWEKLTARRKRTEGRRRTEKELEIEKKLNTYVSVKFNETPLAEAVEHLAQLAGINVVLDPLGMREEGVMSNTPVSIDLSQEIMLKSALNLILEPLHLTYIIKDEVLKVTSEHVRDDGALIQQAYNVADLVIPIPHFQPSNRMGMTSMLHDAYSALGYGGTNAVSNFANNNAPLVVMASQGHNSRNKPNGGVTPDVLAQMASAGGAGFGSTPAGGMGPGGMGGGAMADFDTLIDLITTTIAPTSWDEVGGVGAIQPFPTNLSLVISNTEEVHEQIVDLLDQLRRLQDLQVTIEVRFITLNDNFFERIGIDFDFDIDDDIDAPFQVFGQPDPEATPTFTPGGPANAGPGRDLQDRDGGPSVTVGMSQPGVFSTDLDIPFRQGSFDLAIPQFGGFDPSAGATLGFAILSDLEAFFFINAAQGDRRSNVLQAPKVTLFNGQQASVFDVSQSPFVVSVIPVVGDFAAAQQPVIVVLSEGTSLTVQAVVSQDRRFVRLTVVPFFSQIGEVNTFTFTGSSTTVENSSSEGPDDDTTSRATDRTTTTEGTTVQLPTFAFVSVATTVSVPDGGSVLLGGIKRLSEGRNEFGVPLLNKIPYVNRLFKNVAVGRETQSLMMMVTPRIIIQEEEEALLGISPVP